MTEDEMKQTWCPHVRVMVRLSSMVDAVVVVNRGWDSVTETRTRCLGSGCSQWRRDDVPNPEYIRVVQSNMAFNQPHPPVTIKSETDGHCGLAGRP